MAGKGIIQGFRETDVPLPLASSLDGTHESSQSLGMTSTRLSLF